MTYPVYITTFQVREIYLDTFGHMNNAMYLTLFEDARWEFITQRGYDMRKIRETGLGPTVLDIKLQFLKEIRLRNQITIESQLISYEKKIGKLQQRMMREGEICTQAEFTFGLFSVHERKLVLPTSEWLHAVGCEDYV